MPCCFQVESDRGDWRAVFGAAEHAVGAVASSQASQSPATAAAAPTAGSGPESGGVQAVPLDMGAEVCSSSAQWMVVLRSVDGFCPVRLEMKQACHFKGSLVPCKDVERPVQFLLNAGDGSGDGICQVILHAHCRRRGGVINTIPPPCNLTSNDLRGIAPKCRSRCTRTAWVCGLCWRRVGMRRRGNGRSGGWPRRARCTGVRGRRYDGMRGQGVSKLE